MILTCPSCATRYNVKAGAIPPEGRTVRCAACGNKWHADPQLTPEPEAETTFEEAPPHVAAAAPPRQVAPPSAPEPAPPEPGPPPSEDSQGEAMLAAPPEPEVAEEIAEQQERQNRVIDDRATDTPFEQDLATDAAFTGTDPIEEPEAEAEARSRGWLWLLALVVLVAAAAAAFYFLAPSQWRQQVGLTETAANDSPFDFILTRQNHSTLASGQRLLSISGRVVNVTSEEERVPPIRAELRNAEETVVHSWTIAPPAPLLGPGESASFNSAETDMPLLEGDLDIVLLPSG